VIEKSTGLARVLSTGSVSVKLRDDQEMIDIEAIKRAALKQFKLSQHSIHGLSHWERVHAHGLAICQAEPTVDRVVVECFAYLHDCQRRSDGRDPQHGPRAATYCSSIRRTLLQDLSDKQFKDLVLAITHHTDGKTTQNLTVGACWDADRLDLTRCGVRPSPSFLSTSTDRQLAKEKRD
jgi:uncharacterized protein